GVLPQGSDRRTAGRPSRQCAAGLPAESHPARRPAAGRCARVPTGLDVSRPTPGRLVGQGVPDRDATSHEGRGSRAALQGGGCTDRQMTRLTRNVIFNVLGQGVILVLSLIAVRFIFRQLGDDVFGIIFFNLVMTSVLTNVLELGVSSTIVREVSSRFDPEPDYIRDLVRTASTLYWSIGIVLVIAI